MSWLEQRRDAFSLDSGGLSELPSTGLFLAGILGVKKTAPWKSIDQHVDSASA
jgi:hypothetical protein